MNYLVCENCGGYYPLMEGESPNDFDSCECGGILYLLEYEEENQIQPTEIVCESCGNINNIHTLFCNSCGQILKPVKGMVVEKKESFFKPGVFAGLTFVVVSIMFFGLFL